MLPTLPLWQNVYTFVTTPQNEIIRFPSFILCFPQFFMLTSAATLVFFDDIIYTFLFPIIIYSIFYWY